MHQSHCEKIHAFKELCRTIITERRELINSTSELKEKKAANKRKPIIKIENQSTKKPIKNAILSSQYRSERAEKVANETCRPPVKGSTLDKHSLSEACAKHGITQSNWLTDEHIYKFAQKYQTKFNKFNFLIMSTPVYQSDNQIAGFLRSHLTNDSLVILSIILVNDNHWILGMINLKSNSIAVLDSLGGERHESSFKRLLMIARMSLYGLGKRYDSQSFIFLASSDCPKQENFDDCGVFTCRFIKNILTKNPRKFRIKQGEYRNDIAELLDNCWAIKEPPRPNSLARRPADLLREDSFLSGINNSRIKTSDVNYSQLVKLFH